MSSNEVRQVGQVGRVGLVALGVALLVGAPRAQSSPRLKFVAIVSRHGVRAPTWTPERLNQYSSSSWPDFGVPPGNLTSHGRELMSLMGAYYRAWLGSDGLLKGEGCTDASRFYVWADTDQRTLETGRALAEAMLPGCAAAVHSLKPGEADPLFDPISAGVVKADAAAGARAVNARVGDREALLRSRAAEFSALDRILTAGAAAPQTPFRAPEAFDVVTNGNGVELTGSLAIASTLTENLLLEYTTGLKGPALGWGRLNRGGLQQVLELHALYADLMRRTPTLARARGSILLSRLVKSMQQAIDGKAVEGALGAPSDTVLVVSGHDTNLSNLSGMLGLSWKLPDYPKDDTPPGGALVFSVWGGANGEATVKIRYVSQTLDQMHEGQPLTLATPPAFEELTVPGCASPRDACSWEAFSRAASTAMNP